MKGKMRASVMYGIGQVKTEEVDIPEIGSRDVLIKVKFCGICPSDIKYYTGARKPESWPTIRGHEFSGEIAEVGNEVRGFEPGERVVGHGRTPCGRCYFCLREGPNVNYCLNLQTAGKESGGGTGAFCEYTRVHAVSTYKIPFGVSLEEAAFAEPLACCLNAVMRSKIMVGDTVAVIGDGPNGLIIARLAKIMGAGKAIAIGHHDERLEVARRLGVDFTINSAKEDPVKAVKGLTDGRGADSVILSVDSLSALRQGLGIVRKEGLVNFFSSYPPLEVPIDPNALLHAPSISLVGTRDFQPMHFVKGLELMANKSIDLKQLITHILPLERTEEGFKMATERKSLKILINCS
ncbi:MAG: alcohol dehydrogenase catalytic domain-containing protein [Candidatus Bathyarchaeia archaeon]